MRRLIKFIVVGTLFFSFMLTSVSAHEIDKLKYESVNPPDGINYGGKRLKEKVFLFFYSVSARHKADYYQKLSAVRLSELHFVVDKKDTANIEKASQRYYSTIGDLTQFVISESLDGEKGEVLAITQGHLPILEGLRNSYDEKSAEWRFIEDDINYLKIYSSYLSQ